MTNTMLTFQAISQDMTRSLSRVAAKPDVASETANFKKMLGSIKSLDDFMANDRVYRYTLEAFGLGDMAYAKAFIRKILQEGVSSPSSMANRLSDTRYRELAKAFDFAGEAAETTYFEQNIAKVKTVSSFVAPNAKRMFDYAMKAFGLESMADTALEKQQIELALHLGSDSQIRFKDPELKKRFGEFLKTFDFSEQSTKTTSDKAAMASVVTRYNAVQRAAQQTSTIDKYMRQRLEVDAGASDENLRLALYFERKAPTIKNAYQVLADPALAQVVRTVLDLPSEIAGMDIDKQAALYEKRLNFADLQDPVKVKKLLSRFSAMSDAKTSSTSASGILSLIAPTQSIGVNADVLFSIQKLRLGGR